MASSNTRPSTSFEINMQDAESVLLSARVLKPLDEVLRCHICFDYFTNCMMTKCNHNYCSVCIRRYMNYKSQCPTCFQEATEPELQNNRLIDEILRIYKKIRETLRIPSDSTSKPFPDQSGCSKSVTCDNPGESDKPEISSHSENKQQNTEVGAIDEVSCPVCYIAVPNSRINAHLDSCLKQSDERNQRKFLPKLVYHLLSDKEIRKKLKEHGLNTAGNRQALIRRHKNFIILYNANCDSLNPKPVSDLLLEIERQEIEERLNTPQKNIQVVNKKSDPSVIEKEHESYVQEHKSQFNALIQDVQERAIGRKPVKEEFYFTEDTSNITDEAGNVIGETTLKIGSTSHSDPEIVKEEPSESLLQDAYLTDNTLTEDKGLDSGMDYMTSDYSKTSQLSFRIKKELPTVKIKEDSPSLLDGLTNQGLTVDNPSLEAFDTSKTSISRFYKKKYARRLSTEEKNTQRKK